MAYVKVSTINIRDDGMLVVPIEVYNVEDVLLSEYEMNILPEVIIALAGLTKQERVQAYSAMFQDDECIDLILAGKIAWDQLMDDVSLPITLQVE